MLTEALNSFLPLSVEFTTDKPYQLFDAFSRFASVSVSPLASFVSAVIVRALTGADKEIAPNTARVSAAVLNRLTLCFFEEEILAIISLEKLRLFNSDPDLRDTGGVCILNTIVC
ncbi:hypothetical protein [uncultured Parasutterella sp.]|uniref:hypothetical protein n=1 Tax=uncultured Parasutterella sp. TaxID=1263098 RepID=UPI002616EF26|nr:hypothetical protein [uncultured Parasutterella sp.]